MKVFVKSKIYDVGNVKGLFLCLENSVDFISVQSKVTAPEDKLRNS